MLLKQQFTFFTLAAAAAAACLPAYTADISLDGCYTDSTAARRLTGNFVDYTSTNTPQVCADACGYAGWKYAGVEYT